MKRARRIDREDRGSVKQGIGFLLIAFAVVDFASSWAGTNLTPFLGDLSFFSPMIFGGIGMMLINSDKS